MSDFEFPAEMPTTVWGRIKDAFSGAEYYELQKQEPYTGRVVTHLARVEMGDSFHGAMNLMSLTRWAKRHGYAIQAAADRRAKRNAKGRE